MMIRLILMHPGIIAALLFAPVPVLADGPPKPVPSRQLTGVFEPDPEGVWRIITQDDKTGTSDCIGEPVSPVCAIDTIRACGVRHKHELCLIAWGDNPAKKQDDFFYTKPTPGRYTKYRIVSVRQAKPKDAGKLPMPNPTQWRKITKIQEGDILISMQRASCYFLDNAFTPSPNDSCDVFEPLNMPSIFVLRKVYKAWVVVDNFVPKW